MPRKANARIVRRVAPKSRVPRAMPRAQTQAAAYRKPKASQSVNPAVNALARGAGSAIGNAIVPGVGGVLGGLAGDVGHRLFKSITGMGDYQVNKNSLMTDQVPQFGMNNRVTRVKHREFIADVISGASNSFKIQTFNINPAITGTFPWLSSIAANYENYRILGMIFEFKTMSADALNSTNTALGQVIMATQYNVLSPTFSTKQQMENYEFGSSTKPSCSLIHPVECQPTESPIDELYVRNTSVSGSDLRLYDFAKFSIATNGLQGANVNLGELWVSYDIELLKPRLGNTRSVMDHINIPNTPADLGTVTASSLFGTNPQNYVTSRSTFGCTYSANTITFPAGYTGNVLLYYYAIFTTGAVVAPTFTPLVGAQQSNLMINYSAHEVRDSGTSNVISTCATVYCNNGGIVTLTGGVLGLGVVAVDLFVVSFPDPMN